MKKIINNKVYDTATARNLGGWTTTQDPSSPVYLSETLYRKKNGEFFLYCSGRPSSVPGASMALDEKILPLTFDQASEWGQAHLPEAAFSATFGRISSTDDRRITVTLSVSSALWDAAKKEASRRGVTLSGLVESLLSDYLS